MKHWRMLLTVGFLLISASQAWAIPLTVGGSPNVFGFIGGAGGIVIPSDSFQLTTTSSVRIDLTDILLIGDQYRLSVTGSAIAMMTTSPILSSKDGVLTGALTFTDAWANPFLSKGSLYLGPGIYQLGIEAIRVAPGFNLPGGYIRAVNVPEPSALLMLGAGILGLGLFQYRKWSRTNR